MDDEETYLAHAARSAVAVEKDESCLLHAAHHFRGIRRQHKQLTTEPHDDVYSETGLFTENWYFNRSKGGHNTMFNNQLTAKELYTTNPSQFLQRPGVRSDQEDSAFNSSQTTMSQLSNSQMISSQIENSQSSSFDMFSQMMSQQQGFSQQTENTNDPQRFYLKYMSKAPLFSKEPDKNPLPRKRSYQEQLESHKQKAKERDDRDLVNTFINLVKECTDEVKSAATQIRRNVDKNISESANQFDRLIQKINEDLRTYHNTLTDAVKTREEQRAMLEELQQCIAAKDAKIEVLELQLEAAKQQRDERVVKSLLEAYREQQKENREQITRMQEEQQAFCKTQINKLVQKDQEKYMPRCQPGNSKDVAGSSDDQYMMAQDGLRHPGPVMTIGRSCSWQGMPHLEQSGFPSRPANGYQEDIGYLKMHQATRMSQQNDISDVAVGNPGHRSFNHYNGTDSFPRQSGRWSTPLGFQHGQHYMQSVNQCESGYSINHAAANQQMRFTPDIPSCGQDTRPSGYTTQKNGIGPAMLSPISGCNLPMQWTSNRLKPSPVAAVAPQVKPKETVSTSHMAESQDSQENRQHVEKGTPVSAPPRKRGRKQYQIAVKTKRQSARVKAKQNMSSLSSLTKKNEVSNQKNMPQNGRKENNVEKPGVVPPGSEVANKDVYEYREPEIKTAIHSKKQPHKVQTVRCLEEYSPAGGIQRKAQNAKKRQKMCHSKPMSEVPCHVPQQVQKTNTVHVLPKMANKDGYEYKKAVKKTNRSVTPEVERGKQTGEDVQKFSGHNMSQDDIFSQKRVNSHSRSKDTKHGSLEMLPNKTHAVTAQGEERDRRVNISEDESYYDSQTSDVDTSQELLSQELINDDNGDCSNEQITKTAERRDRQSNRKPYENLGQMKQQGNKLGSMSCFSDQDDSAEDLTFSLKLPDSPSCKMSRSCHSKKAWQTEEQVVPVAKTLDILSTPNIQLPEDQDSDNESICTVYSLTSGRKISRHLERKRRLSRYSESSSAAMVKITNSLRLQHHKKRRVSSHC